MKEQMTGWVKVASEAGVTLWKDMNNRNCYAVTLNDKLPTGRVTRKTAVTNYKMKVIAQKQAMEQAKNRDVTNITELAEFFPED
jgi:hypothetical protein